MRQLDQNLDAFKSQWRLERPTNLPAFLGQFDDWTSEFFWGLVEIDIEHRWRKELDSSPGSLPGRPLIEDYLRLLSQLPESVAARGDRPAAAATIPDSTFEAEMHARWKTGDRVPADQYEKRFPQLSPNSREQLRKLENELGSEIPNNDPFQFLHQSSLTSQDFAQRLVRSGLVGKDQVQQTWKDLPSGERSLSGLAKALGTSAKLTPFQALKVSEEPNPQLIIGSYVIQDKLGEGGMGQVYRAVHRKMKREVALKVISPHVLKDAHAIARFNREVEAAAKLSHPNIVTAFDAGEVGGVHFLVMEYIVGMDLTSRIRRGGIMSLEQAIDCTLQAARGLVYAHSKGIVHRDIKPSNLLLDDTGVVRVLDLGLARIDQADEQSNTEGLTSTGMVMGTVDYMAPEQALDSKAAEARSDIYSLGCTMFFLISGHSVFDGDTIIKRILAHRDQPLPELTKYNRHASPRLQAAFNKMLAKRAEDRFQSMSDTVSELEAVLQESGQHHTNANKETTTGSADPTVAFSVSPLAGQREVAGSVAVLEPTIQLRSPPLDPSAEITTSSAAFDDTLKLPGLADAPSAPSVSIAEKPKVRSGAGRGRNGSKTLAFAGGGFLALLLFGGMLFKFRGQDGTVFVVLDSQIELASIEVDGNEVGFSPDGSTTRIKFSVNPGAHKLTLKTSDGLELTTDLGEKPLEIAAGKTAKLRAWVEKKSDMQVIAKVPESMSSEISPKPNQDSTANSVQTPSQTVAAKDPHRRAAEMIIAGGGSVAVMGKEGHKGYSKLEDLPSGRMCVMYVAAGPKGFNDEELIDFDGVDTMLHGFNAPGSSFTTKGAAILGGLDSLSGITCNTATDESVAELSQAPDLQFLELNGSPLTDAACVDLGKMPRLRDLYLGGPGITDQGLESLSLSPNLRYLSLNCPNVRGRGIEHLSKLQNLQCLHLDYTGIDDASLPALEKLTNLRELVIAHTAVSDTGATQLQKQLPNTYIHHPALSTSDVDRRVAQWIIDLKGLGQTEPNPGPLQQKPEQQFNVHHIDLLHHTNPPKHGTEILDGLPAIVGLHWSGLQNTQTELVPIGKLVSLTGLGLGSSDVSGTSLQHLGELQQLEDLQLTSSKQLSDDSLKSLPAFPHLRILGLGDTAISDAGLSEIAKLENLQILSLDACRNINGNGLAKLASLRNLRQLGLSSSGVTDSAAAQLSQLKSLRILQLGNTTITAQAAAKIQAALPKCVVFHESLRDTPWSRPEAAAVDPN